MIRRRLSIAIAIVLFGALALLVGMLAKSAGFADAGPSVILPAADAAALTVPRRASQEDAASAASRDAMSDASASTLRSPGCGTPAPPVAGALLGTADGRTFRIFPPKGYDPGVAYPVLFTYHGIDSNGGQFEAWFKMEDHVNGEAIVVYPDARKTSYGGTAWELAGPRDLVAFDDIRSAVAASFCVDLARVYAMGFSYGGKFVTALACNRAGVVRAVSSNDASWGNQNEKRCGQTPMLVTHRTNDPDERIEWGRASADTWARINGCDMPKVLQPTDDAHGCADYAGCLAKVTFCEDRYVNENWPKDWNHTVREEYRDLVWRWLRER